VPFKLIVGRPVLRCQYKERLFPYTALTGGFYKPIYIAFTT